MWIDIDEEAFTLLLEMQSEIVNTLDEHGHKVKSEQVKIDELAGMAIKKYKLYKEFIDGLKSDIILFLLNPDKFIEIRKEQNFTLKSISEEM
jgi:hypothetical protein